MSEKRQKILMNYTKVDDLFQTIDSAEVSEGPCTFFADSLTALLSSPSRVMIVISVGTVVDDLCEREGVGKSDAMLPSLIYIEWS